MKINSKKPWLQQMISEGKIKPQLMPDDFFFQYKKNQPYKIKSSFNENSNFRLNFPQEIQKFIGKTADMPTIRKKGTRSSLDFIDKKIDLKKAVERKIKRQQSKLDTEIHKLLLNNRRNSINQYFIDELKSNRENYRKISDRITVLTLRKYSK